MPTSIYISTSIPYVNSSPHIGHAQEFALADFLAREYRRLGHDVFFQSGADENGAKNVRAAASAGVAVETHVEQQTAKFRALLAALEVVPDRFVRTSSPEHKSCVADFLRRLRPEDLTRQRYRGLYCTGCEDFLGPAHVGVCPDHLTEPELLEEENLFFKLSNYQEVLIQKITRDELKIRPVERKNEVLAFLRRGLNDISLTRPASRTGGWGVRAPFPGGEDQVVYVWIDALINYLTGAGFSSETTGRWTSETHKIHVIGKNIVKFHAIYWPALLLSAGLPLPNEIVVHAFLTNEGVKISKSLGNGLDPLALVEGFSASAVRHYLLAELSLTEDADFKEGGLRAAYEANLANRLGNLLSRLVALRARASLRPDPSRLLRREDSFPNLSIERIREYAREQIWNEVDRWNLKFDRDRPWEWLKLEGQPGVATWIRECEAELGALFARLASWYPSSAAKALRILEGFEPPQPLFPRRE